MNVASFIYDQPQPQCEIMTVLRTWILDLAPGIKETISYKIPFFNFYGSLCYLNPTEEGVDFGFTKGYELHGDNGMLEAKGRKRVKTVTFHSIAELEENEEIIRRLLNEAAILNEFRFKRKSKKLR